MVFLDSALEMLSKHPLCDNCLGRQFALLGYNIENQKRGNAIKLALVLKSNKLHCEKVSIGLVNLKVLMNNAFSQEAIDTLKHLEKEIDYKKTKKCYLCDNNFQSIEKLVNKALFSLEDYDFETFLVGIKIPLEFEERNDEFKALFNVVYGESIRHEFARLIGKKIADLAKKTPEYKNPDLQIILNPFTNRIILQVNPLFIAGKYRKFVRTIPQSKWFCSTCRGRGCNTCKGTGKLYPESVEELASDTILKITEGKKTSFHASGREDIDALMLGSGRPFVIEVSKPKKRDIDLALIQQKINESARKKIEVLDLKFVDKEFVRKLKKGESAKKEYRALIEFEKNISESRLSQLVGELTNTLVKQQTPIRVLHRRADLTRERYIYSVNVKKVSPRKAEIILLCQGGLYIKELVSGDEGRTMPSISSLMENKAKTLELDVLNVILDLKNEGKIR